MLRDGLGAVGRSAALHVVNIFVRFVFFFLLKSK